MDTVTSKRPKVGDRVLIAAILGRADMIRDHDTVVPDDRAAIFEIAQVVRIKGEAIVAQWDDLLGFTNRLTIPVSELIAPAGVFMSFNNPALGKWQWRWESSATSTPTPKAESAQGVQCKKKTLERGRAET